MASHESHSDSSEQVTARVRQNAFSAAIAAALMLYYGFGGGEWIYPEEGFARAGGYVFVFTLKIGGLAMLASALGSALGTLHALVFDAVCSILIGALFILGSLLMLLGGSMGFNLILYAMFGVMFITAGLRNGRNWAEMASARSAGADEPMSHELNVGLARAIDDGPMPTQAGDLGFHDSEPAASIEDRSSSDSAEPPPEGFLASFAPEDRRDDE
ncbi:MAG: hypothetical protein IID39_08300 [Planctomycetes bacterium]|nr:hypothetical protein [Planctomycetota bacterium]